MERIWLVWYEAGSIWLAPEDGLDAKVLILTAPQVESVSLAFDANMNPTIAYMEAGVCKLRWFDSTVSQMVTTTFPGVTSCQCTTDDKRQARLGVEDVIFAYVRDAGLYYRQQRDRYTIEYLLKSPVLGQISRLGMNTKTRLQFELI
jgi:hypothetical protein